MTMYELAKEKYASIGIDTDAVIKKAKEIPISMHCWQGDDVRGFESGEELSGGIQSTGSHPGAAESPDELRTNIEKAMGMIPGILRVNLHAIYGDVKGVERDAIEPGHFAAWTDWAKSKGISLDFNPTLFSHPKSADGLTLAHPDKGIRDFWIEHCKKSRRISENFGRELGSASVMNLWIVDGFKDIPADQYTPRVRLNDALDEIFSEKIDQKYNIDVVESKLFGIGLESYTVGSHEFYLAYAVKNGLGLCLDAGHFHPLEYISPKISACALFLDHLLLHVSRPVRWDSDHVVLLDNELVSIAQEITRHGIENKVHVGLDYFDGSIDRIYAWAIGARNMRKALLIALLEPAAELKKAEYEFDFTKRLTILEELKSMPWTVVWERLCEEENTPPALVW